MIKDFWKRSLDEKSIFVIVWTVLPLLFFSLSSSKLPHYILPMYPALSIMTGETVARIFRDRARNGSWLLYFPWLCEILPVLYLSAGSTWPALLPGDIRQPVAGMSQLYLFGVIILMAFAAFSLADSRGPGKHERVLYPLYCFGLLIFFLFVSQTMKLASLGRSAKELAKKTAPFIGAENQSAVYDTYFSGLPFYLQVNRPIWVVWSGAKRSIMGSFYIAEKHPQPAAGYGKVLFTFEEFGRQWKLSSKRLLVFIREKDFPKLKNELGVSPEKLAKLGDVLLVANP